ncbi:hypothetical protein L0337_20660 [candidate division KSB1 bacterium]|nr:hypothetical protein [candidate division KSB1 bacterium]
MRKYLIPAAILAAGLALGGCAARPEVIAARLAGYDATCRAMGFQPGADNYKLCRLTVFQTEENRRARIDAERTAAAWRYLQGIGELGSASNPLNVRVTGY